LIQDSAGNLYGTTAGTLAGTTMGSVFKLSPSGKFRLLHNFGAGGTDGAAPYAGLIQDKAGSLCGSTSLGGSYDQGTVFKLDKNGKFNVLHSFFGVKDGSDPIPPLVFDPAGNLYGTTYLGGATNCDPNRSVGCGSVFEVNPTTGREKVLHRFSSSRKDGDLPYGGVLRDAAGNLYGTASLSGPHGFGTVFKLDPSGNETVLYAFQLQSGGIEPGSGLIQDIAGNFYGSTIGGDGNIYKLDPQGNETVLHRFNGSDGSLPLGNLIMDSAGNFYGTANRGGIYGSSCYDDLGCGTVFKLDPSGNLTVLYSFSGATDGGNPYSGVIMDAAGNLYGTASYGGAISKRCPSGCGVVFEITP
jgi:uncharacterized repeat protein (TIGR03803 family)